MYKKSRLKFVVLIVSVLLLLWIATLSIIYFTTDREVATQNREMMELYAKAYAQNGTPDASEDTEFHDELGVNPKRLQVTTFYSVAFKEDGTEVTNDGPPLFTDEELIELTSHIVEKNKTFGMTDSMVYLVSKEDSYTLVVIMDNTMVGDTMNLIERYMLLIGGVAVIVLIGIAYLFSGWIMRPLEENDKKQQQFISDAGHELKTPISTVNANVELLERNMGDNIWLSNIKYESNRMEKIVKQLLDLARMQDIKTEFTDIDMSRTVIAGVLPFEAQAYEKGLHLDYEVPDGIHINGNLHQMQMLISTLLDNAFSHTQKNGSIQIELQKQHNKIELVVANEGKEIPEEERERIFDRFYRSDIVRNGNENHYGLGLAIAKSIVQLHQGSIYVVCKGGWTEFHVEI